MINFRLWAKISNFRRQIFNTVVKTSILLPTCPEKYFEGNSFLQNEKFKNYLIWSKTLWIFVEKFRQAWLDKTACYVLRTILWKMIFWKNNNLPNIFRNGMKKLRNFGKNFSAGLSKLNSTFPEERSRKNLIFEEIIFWQFFSLFERKNFSFLEKYGKFVENVFSLSRGTFWGEFFFRKKKRNFTITFGLWANNSQTFSEKFPKGLSELHSIFLCVQRSFLRKRLFCKSKKTFEAFGFDQNISGYSTKIFDSLVKNAFFVSKNIFRKNEFFVRIIISDIFIFCVKTFGIFSANFPAGLSCLNSTCPGENFKEFCCKNNTFSKVSDFWQKLIGFLTKYFNRVVKTVFWWSRETFWRKIYCMEQ